ncbi:MAG TPA: hypothetical protein VNM92_08620 [Thermoanaerobaculia bacterium]|nr:hypothetical protein [Thermoanaerobaculia bacterium]
MSDLFSHDSYLIRTKIFSLFSPSFFIESPTGKVILFTKKKAFKLKEDIRVYTGEDQRTEVLTIQARSLLDFSAAYDVVDSRSGETVGALRREGLRSMLRDQWQILNPQGAQIGTIREDSDGLALARRFLSNLIPQSFDILMTGTVVGEAKQNFNPFHLKMELDFSLDTRRQLDRRLGVAAGILLATIEGRQKD